MPQGPRDPKSRAMFVVLVLLAAVVLRGWFFLRFDESYFDSDQAIVGLMAKHLVEGRAFPSSSTARNTCSAWSRG